MSGTVVGTGDSGVNKNGPGHCPHGACLLVIS